MFFHNRMLGKGPAVIDSRTLKLKTYLELMARPEAQTPLPAPAPSFDWTPDQGCPKSWPMFLNDTLGTCVVASALHKIQEWTGLVGDPLTPTDQDALNIYEIFGYKPNDPSTDKGIDMLSFMKYWRKTGLPIQGKTHKILAFASVDHTQQVEVGQAISLFGNVDIGVALPVTAQNQVIWSVVPNTLSGPGAPGSWGGHCIPALAYTLRASYPGGLKILTWGAVEEMTWNFLQCYCDELFAILAPEWIEASGLAPSGFPVATLLNDIAALQEPNAPSTN
jgi:hypothetical protein